MDFVWNAQKRSTLNSIFSLLICFTYPEVCCVNAPCCASEKQKIYKASKMAQFTKIWIFPQSPFFTIRQSFRHFQTCLNIYTSQQRCHLHNHHYWAPNFPVSLRKISTPAPYWPNTPLTEISRFTPPLPPTHIYTRHTT